MPESKDPLREYTARRGKWLAKQRLFERQFILIGNWRLGVGGAGAVLAWLALSARVFSVWWLLLPVGVFITLAVWHQRVIRKRTFAERAIRYYDRGLARLNDDWQGKGEAGERFRDQSHVYAEDLDVFGKGSLFELLSTARTAAGEDTLAAWLLSPATFEQATSRQQAVIELRAQLDLREDIALLGEDVRAGLHADAVARWGALPPVPFPAFVRPLALGLTIAGLASGIALLAQLLPLWPFAAILALDVLVIYFTRQQVAQIVSRVDTPAVDLAVLAGLIARIEHEVFTSPLLSQMLARFRVSGLPATKRIQRLERWIEMLNMSSHPIMRVIRLVLLWQVQVAFAIETWRQETGPHIGAWLQALAEFEALSCLGSLAFERPHWTFPQLSQDTQAAFEAHDLRHPLMKEARCVPNDVSLNGTPRLLIVSGSNMSGKSTLLRAIGLNTVLAWTGAPVSAASLRMSALETGASIRITDSLQDNRSRFFAEITRLRQIADLTRKGRPVLFLLDELLSGTNSHDRRIGAAGIVRGLLRGETAGLITTHDLALTEIADEVGAAGANVHFEDRIIDGQAEFDYKLRPGIVTHSNALELMRAVGLEV